MKFAGVAKNALFLIFVLQALPVVADKNESSNSSPVPQTLKLYLENDVLLISDREYTNGARLEYGVYSETYSPSNLLLGGVSFLFPSLKNKAQSYSGVGFQHLMFTPLNLFSSDASYGERPYSSLALLSNMSQTTWEKSALAIETSLGQMGPSVQGKYFQESIHNLTNSPLPQGWDSQIPNRNIYQVNLDWRYFWTPYIGIQSTLKYGNMDTSVGFGPVFRIGKVHSPVSGGSSMSDPTPVYYTEETESYFYFKPSVKDQSYNGTLGGTGKSQPSAIVSAGDSPSLYFNNGQAVFLGEPLYNSVGDERSNSSYTRFLIYQRTVDPTTPYGVNFLIFNTIFNGAQVPENGLKLPILQTILDSKIDLSKYPGIELFLYDTLFRDQTTGVSIYSKLLAYRYFFSSAVSQPETNVITLLLLYNEQNSDKTYHVDVRRIQGRFSTGYVYQSPGWFFQVGIELMSLEYSGAEGVSPFHRYSTVQLGKKF
jgi:hypothetical protein